MVAALSNGLRVALIGVLAYQFDAPLHGPVHMLHGLFVAAIGYVVLFAGLRWLARGEGPLPAAKVPGALRPVLRVPVFPVAVLALAFWWVCGRAAHAPDVEPAARRWRSARPTGQWTLRTER